MDNPTTNDNCRDERSMSTRSIKEEMYSYKNTGCFFCHKEPIKGAEDNHQDMTTVNIKDIVPYLNIKSSNVDNECEFSVTLCVKCSSVSMKLKESMCQMEMAKRQVNRQLQELQQLFNESSKKQGEEVSNHDSRGKALRISRYAVVSTENISNQKEVQLLGVTKQKTANCENAIVIDLTEDNADFSLARKSLPNFTRSDADGITEAENAKPTKCDTPMEWIAELMRQSERRFQHKKRIDRFYCPFCEDYDKDKRGLTSQLRFHLMGSHTVEFFIKKLSPTLSEDIIRNHFKRILSKQVKEMKPENGQPKSTTKNPDVLCHICNRKCASVTSSKNHIILDHYTILEEQLMSLKSMGSAALHQAAQEYDSPKTFLNSINPALQEILSNLCREKPGSGSSNPKRFNCGICQSGKYKDKSTVFKHLLGIHIEQIFASKRLSDICPMDFKNCCAQVLAAVSKLNKNEDFVYSLCKFKHHDRCRIQNHLVVEHSDILGGRLVRFQEDALSSGYIQPKTDEAPLFVPKPRRKRKSIKRPGVSQVGNSVPVPVLTKPANMIVDKKAVKSEIVQNIFAKFSTRIGRGETLRDGYRCGICPGTSLRAIHSKGVIQKHLIHDHPDLLFPGKKLPEVPGVKFQDYCKTVARDRSNYVVQYKNGVLCSFCGWKGRDCRTVRRHIMLMHHNVLEYKLDCLQGKKGRTASKGRTSSEMGFDTGPSKVKKIKLNPASSMRPEVASGSSLGSATGMGSTVMGPQEFTEVSKDEGQTGKIDFCDPLGQLGPGPSYSPGNVSHFIDESYEIEEETNEPDESSYEDTNDWEMKPDSNCCEVVINEEDADGSVGAGNEMQDSTSMMYFEEEEPIVKMENDNEEYII